MAKKSLFAQTQETTSTAVAPSGFFKQPAGLTPIVAQTAVNHPYVQFYHGNSPNAQKLRDAFPGIAEPQPVLVFPGDRYVKLEPLQFFAFRYFQAWAQFDDQGAMTHATLEPQRHQKGSPWRDLVEILAIVITPEGPVPAMIRCKSTRAGVGKDAAKALAYVMTPEFATKYPDAAAMDIPPFRVCIEARFNRVVSKGSGRANMIGSATWKPTSSDDHKRIREWIANPKNVELCEAVDLVFDNVVTEIKTKAGGKP